MSRRLNETDALGVGDQFVLYKGNCTDFRSVPQDVILSWILSNIPVVKPVSAIIQPFNPNANFTKEIDNNAAGTYLVINPSAAIAVGTLVLPSVNSIVDGQEVLVTSSQQITDLTIDANGATVIGAPDAMGATAFFKLKYEELSQTWYRVG
ncbi:MULTISPECIES: transcriptional regulator [unclassified Acinetobacter]|uniref:transcriptional regulator n=1 Tax=unclassified Acinetobacter TaxID=196816 RepID=UPI002D1E7D85|nr:MULTISPECIES: transcriptional regulator [unclassified Acinetobacter]MEB3793857.1 transcriptional regulator [Acinetobacter sp. IK24]MEB3812773.1 transcriptional regulator [Acinetobacter sp. IK22]MEB3832254.1 transcriptional regulator [Acinetobacter sp. IK23]MEB3837407.1 transcriptional regulator [Acinetobacter sp. IK25]